MGPRQESCGSFEPFPAGGLFYFAFLRMSMTTIAELHPPEGFTKKLKLEAPETTAGSLLVRKLSPHATIPTRGSSMAAGYDLYR